jgi:hypothetical protein
LILSKAPIINQHFDFLVFLFQNHLNVEHMDASLCVCLIQSSQEITHDMSQKHHVIRVSKLNINDPQLPKDAFEQVEHAHIALGY